MSEENSPTYAAGLDDGWADEARIKSCPPAPPLGPYPPFPHYPIMYLRGYFAVYTDEPHRCNRECRRRAERDGERRGDDNRDR